MVVSMRKLPVHQALVSAICFVAMSTVALPAQADALPGEGVPDASMPAKSVANPTLPDAPAEAAARGHVRHLRAHKKFDANALTDPTQSASKPENAQSDRKKTTNSDETENADVTTASPPTTVKVIARPRAKIVRTPKKIIKQEQTGQSANHQSVRERDFFSDIFGGGD